MPAEKLCNKNCNINLNFCIKISRWVMKAIGVWPKPLEASIHQIFLRYLTHLICYGILVFLSVPSWLVLFLEVNNIYNRIRMTGPLLFSTMAILKYYNLIQRENEIRSCIEEIEDDWKNMKFQEDLKLMIRSDKFGRKLTTASACFTYGGAVFYCLLRPLVIGRIPSDDGNHTYLSLGYPVSSLIADTQQDPANTIMFIFQFIAGLATHSIAVASSSLTVVLVMHISGRMDVVTSWLDRVVQNCDKVECIDDIFSQIITHHARTLRFIAQTEYILNHISFVEVIGCTLNMCLLSYYTLQEYTGRPDFTITTYLTVLTYMIANIFVLCYIGEILVGQCKKVGDMSYMIDWYRLPKKRALNIILLMTISSNSRKSKLTAGNIMDLSLSRFGDIVKTSVAYLNMLRQLTT
ncbi:odorant receptor 13a-like isoform X2 [Prorops nasuta]|uniref:odorant receptor 13a-like isoform X2 n=1 Tax=Prorops nasuta TaxID=863751 RepID=UPI0034CD72C9